MELLYIWIDSYKNIHRQGFNFSPKYRFEFNEETLELTYKENKDFPDNFFGDGISNVTAIIGENGSGKSSLLDLLKDILYGGNIYSNHIDFHSSKYVFVFTNLIASTVKPLKNHTSFKEVISDTSYFTIIQKNINSIFYSVIFDRRNELASNSPYFINISDNHLITSIASYYNTTNAYKDYTPIQTFIFEEIKDCLKFLDFADTQKIIIPFKIPDRVCLIFDGVFIETFNLESESKIIKTANTFITEFRQFKDKLPLKDNETNEILVFKVKFVELFVINIFNYFINNDVEDETIDYEKIDGKDVLEKSISFLKHYDCFYNTVRKILDIHSMQNNNLDAVFRRFYLNRIDAQSIIKQFVLDINNLFNRYNLERKNAIWSIKLGIEWQGLSSGELSFLLLFSRFFTIYEQISANNIVIMIDEGELGLHPQWQKEYLKNLIDVLPQIFKDKKIQIILTSHSPFLVSDLPKENIIFLRKGQKEDEELENKCIVVKEGDRKHPKVTQTFGQNIHTLFADSFFMEGGLMGEFAKEKIKNVLIDITENQTVTQKNASRKKEIEFIISQIGEPLLRKKLEKIYQQNIDTNSFKSLSELEEEEKQLKQRLEEITKQKNNKK